MIIAFQKNTNDSIIIISKYHQKNYSKVDEDEFDPSAVNRKRNRTVINVKKMAEDTNDSSQSLNKNYVGGMV